MSGDAGGGHRYPDSAEEEEDGFLPGGCDTCWGSGWLRQFIEPCPDCRGTGQVLG